MEFQKTELQNEYIEPENTKRIKNEYRKCQAKTTKLGVETVEQYEKKRKALLKQKDIIKNDALKILDNTDVLKQRFEERAHMKKQEIKPLPLLVSENVQNIMSNLASRDEKVHEPIKPIHARAGRTKDSEYER